MQPRTKAGILFLIGSLQFLMLMILAETQYPGYSPSENYISDLGLWEHDSAFIFNPSIALFGVITIAGSYIVLKSTDWRTLPFLLIISGIGMICVAVFNEDVEGVHWTVSAIAFGFAMLAAISSYWYMPPAIGAFGLALGALSMLATGLFMTDTYLGIGQGGMERMILYPVLGWMLVFSGYLMGVDQQETKG